MMQLQKGKNDIHDKTIISRLFADCNRRRNIFVKAMYLRKSRAEELMDSDTEVLEKHRRYLSEFAVSRNIVIDDVYEEVVSGESIAARPEMQKLLDAVIDEKYDAVLCMDIDRLGRGGMQDQGIILDAFRESETLIITPDKTYDLTNEIDETFTEFKAFMSRQEYKIIRKRMRRGLVESVKAGGHIGPAPYGYRQVTINKRPTLEIVPEEAEYVKLIFQRYIDGAGGDAIAAELNAMNVRPRKKDVWTRPTIKQMLANPVYIGKIAWNRVKKNKPGSAAYEKQHTRKTDPSEQICVEGLHDAILSVEMWEAAQEAREKRFIPSTKSRKETANPFAGLIYCANCGQRIQRSCRSGVPYIFCYKKGCCASAKFDYVESSILSGLESVLSEIEIEIKSGNIDSDDDDKKIISAIELEIKKVDTRISRLYEFLEDGTYDRSIFRARKRELDEKKAELIRKRTEAESRLEGRKQKKLEMSEEKIKTLLDLYPTLTAAQKNIMLKQIVKKIIYRKEKGTKPAEFQLDIDYYFFD